MNSTKKLSVSSLAIMTLLVISMGCAQKPKVIDAVVQTEYGALQGVINDEGTVAIFRGVPFAAPPVGDLRWKEPQPPEPWEGVRDASEFGPSAIQSKNFRLPWTQEFMVEGDNFSEDCLYLNIWTAAKTAEDNLPVLFFIHGGGGVEGSGSIAVYDGEELAKKGIIVVTVNYRLGILGFFTHPELSAESPHHVSGNYAYLDQIAALQWVKENIKAFGGDPNRVTISGQSAGAGSVRSLLISPLAAGLFNGAITESGSTYTGSSGGNSLEESEKQGLVFAENKGASSLADLRAMTPAELIAVDSTKPLVRFSRVIDGYFQPADIMTVYAEGKQNDVPLITGLNANDNRMTFNGDKNQTYEMLYPSQSEEEAALAELEAAREQNRLNAYLWLEYRANTSSTNGYGYYFAQAIPWPEHPEFGAFHTGEIPYVFNNLKVLDRPFTEVDSMVADVMSSYWANFVKTGDPNGPGLPEWKPYSQTPEMMEIGENMGMIPVAASPERYEFQKEQLLK